ncbi:MAG: recombination mediator RecR [Prevotella sp.]|nr:recombination mediator RecR [Prevotella sp.]MDY5667348.1 recombination mediator RecR [Alloprevotella sp.]
MINEQYPSKLLEHAVQELTRLPGVGRKTALRFALYLLSQSKDTVHSFSDSLTHLRDDVKHCKVCHNISDTEVCDICANPQRDKSTICVVENIHSVMSIENTGQFHGLYHVLGGVISPMDGIGPSDLELESLFARVQTGNINEIILALNPTMEGDTTNFYISRKLADTGIKLSVLARGVSIGDDLEYTDEVTLGRSILGRTPLK